MTGSISQMVMCSIARIACERAGGDARAEADAEHRFRVGMQHAGQVAHHALQLHVVGLGGGLHVAVDVDFDRAIVPARDRDRRIAAFDRCTALRSCRGSSPCAVRRRSVRPAPARGLEESHAAQHHRGRQRRPLRPCDCAARAHTAAESRRRPPAAAHSSTRCVCCVPIHGTSTRLDDERARQSRPTYWPHTRCPTVCPGSSPVRGERRHRQRETRAPQRVGRQNRPQAAHHVELEGVPRADREQRIDGPVGQRRRDDPRRPRNAAA